MGVLLGLRSVSDVNIDKILSNPPLIYRLIEPDDPESYLEAVESLTKPNFIKQLFRKKKVSTEDIPELNIIEGENIEDDLDKSWHGLHYCINKTAYQAEPPMDFITQGGKAVGDIGYDEPPRSFKNLEVNSIYEMLDAMSTDQLKANYDPEKMDQLDIYPGDWKGHGDEGFEYIKENFLRLKKFMAHCIKHELGMIISFL